MSRSRKKRPGGGITVADSDKPYKVAEHRRERRMMAARLQSIDDDLEEIERAIAELKRFGNPWKAPKDGKQYWPECDDKWMRK